MAIMLMLCLTACGGDRPVASQAIKAKKIETATISEVSPPSEIQRLNQTFDRYEPQLTIVSPQPDTILQENQVTVQLSVADLPIFKSSLGLGPHVHVTLDGQEYKPLYDLSESLTFDSLTPGTHTIRAFASRPWHESFKNEGAYAQVTFHVYAKTCENTPNPQLPLLTYSRPVGTYGAEPILMDFYLRNAPLHIAALEDSDIRDWQIRATVNGQSFLMENWQPLYLKGFKPGQNWVKLEFLDRSGNLVANQFNSTVHLIDYQPGGQDALARLMRGEKIANIDKIVDLNYVAPTESAPASQVEPTPPVTVAPVSPTPISPPEPLMPEPTVEQVVPIQPQPSATSSPELQPSATKSEPVQVVPIPVPVAPLTVPAIKQPEAVPVPVNKLPERPPEVVSPKPAPAISAPKLDKPKQEKAKEKSDGTNPTGNRPSFQKMFDRFKQKITPKQEEKVAPQLPITLPAPEPVEKSAAPKPEATRKELAPSIKVAPTVNPAPAKPKGEEKGSGTDPTGNRPSFQKMFDRFKQKITPKQEGKVAPQLPIITAPAIESVEKSAAPKPEATRKELTPSIKVAPTVNPAPAKPKAEEKGSGTDPAGNRPSFQKMFDRFKQKIAPKPASPVVTPKQLEQKDSQPGAKGIQNEIVPAPKASVSIQKKQAPIPLMAPKEEAKPETKSETSKADPTSNWRDRLRQIRKNSKALKDSDSSKIEPSDGISIPESP